MIKVLHVFHTLDRGGAESMIMNVYRKIDVRRVHFDFVVHTKDNCDYLDEIRSLGGKIYRAPDLQMTNAIGYIRWWKAFIRHHQDYKVMHCHVRSTASLYIPIAKRSGIKTIIHSHSTSNGSGLKALVKAFLQFPLRYQADYLMACSEQSAIWLYGKNVLRKKNCIIFKNSVDVDKYSFSISIREEYRKDLRLEPNQLVLCHVGNFTDAKNHEFLIDFFSNLVKRREAVLILVGRGTREREAYIENRIKSLGITDHVRLLGSRNDVAEILSASDVFVFPSKWEGFPMAVLEAQANGLHAFISNNIPDEIVVTELIHRLPINAGNEIWVDTLNRFNYERMDFTDRIRLQGYDTESNAKWLEEFYEKC